MLDRIIPDHNGVENCDCNWYVLVRETETPATEVALYARVSSADQKSDLDGQIARLVQYANGQGWSVSKAVTEIGSGLNGHRPKLMKLLADPKVRTIQQRILLVRHAGTARFAYNWGLARRIELYQQTRKSTNAIAQHRELNALKKTEFPWMYEQSKT